MRHSLPRPNKNSSTTPTSAPSAGLPIASGTKASSPSSPTADTSTATPQTGSARSWLRSSTPIYCYNLRGNQRTAGELSRKEGGKIFGSGSRNTVAILILVKGSEESPMPTASCATAISATTLAAKTSSASSRPRISIPFHGRRSPRIRHGDWISQRGEIFSTFYAYRRSRIAVIVRTASSPSSHWPRNGP